MLTPYDFYMIGIDFWQSIMMCCLSSMSRKPHLYIITRDGKRVD